MIFGGGTIQTCGARAPSQRIAIAAREGRVAEAVARAQRGAGVTVAHAPAGENRRELVGHLLGDDAGLAGVGQPCVGEERQVRRGDDVDLVARPPHLYERRVVPRDMRRALDACVDGQQRSARHAVLHPGPRGPAQRPLPSGEPLGELTGALPERKDLLTRDLERHAGIVSSTTPAAAGTAFGAGTRQRMRVAEPLCEPRDVVLLLR